MSEYNAAKALTEEVDRFERTNRFNPLEVTNLYVQARVVLSELRRAEERAAALEAAIKRHIELENELSQALKAKSEELEGALELDWARACAEEANRLHHAGYGCVECGSFWTMTGWGKEWHERGCIKALAKPEPKEKL